MSEQILEHLFDSPVKVKLLKLFLRNPDRQFRIDDIIRKTQAKSGVARRQVKGLVMIKLVNAKMHKGSRKKHIPGGLHYQVNPKFDFYRELQSLVLTPTPTSKIKLLKKITRLGKIKLALISGVFLNDRASRVDLFLVGDDISNRKLKSFLAEMESEVGKEIEYAALDTQEFEYRFQMFDRFVRDILEKPHEKLINKIRFVE